MVWFRRAAVRSFNRISLPSTRSEMSFALRTIGWELELRTTSCAAKSETRWSAHNKKN